MNDNLDKALADSINKIGEITPEVLNNIVTAYSEVIFLNALIGSILAVSCLLVSFFCLVVSFRSQDDFFKFGSLYGSLFFLVLFLTFCSVNFSQLIAPESFAVQKLIQDLR